MVISFLSLSNGFYSSFFLTLFISYFYAKRLIFYSISNFYTLVCFFLDCAGLLPS